MEMTNALVDELVELLRDEIVTVKGNDFTSAPNALPNFFIVTIMMVNGMNVTKYDRVSEILRTLCPGVVRIDPKRTHRLSPLSVEQRLQMREEGAVFEERVAEGRELANKLREIGFTVQLGLPSATLLDRTCEEVKFEHVTGCAITLYARAQEDLYPKLYKYGFFEEHRDDIVADNLSNIAKFVCAGPTGSTGPSFALGATGPSIAIGATGPPTYEGTPGPIGLSGGK